ncbi:MAG: hypothetical protein AB1657_00435 [Candidatus Micrarchaeota archaeon]
MANDTSAMMNYAGQGMMIAGAGLVGYSVVGSVPPANFIGVPSSMAMVGGLAAIGFGAALSITSKVF